VEPRVKIEEVLPILLPRHAVDSGRGPLAKLEVCVTEPVDGACRFIPAH
jgi:hypothetical protein